MTAKKKNSNLNVWYRMVYAQQMPIHSFFFSLFDLIVAPAFHVLCNCMKTDKKISKQKNAHTPTIVKNGVQHGKNKSVCHCSGITFGYFITENDSNTLVLCHTVLYVICLK